MAQTLLSTDMIARPDRWRLSMEIADDALSVLARPVTGDDEPVAAKITLEGGGATALEEAVYANPLLLAPWQHTDVVVRTDSYVVVAPDIAGDDEARDALLSLLAGGEAAVREAFVSPVDRRNSIVATMSRDVAGFLRRTFDTAVPTHHLSILARFFGRRSALGNTGKVYVNVQPGSIDVVAFNSLGLSAATSFATPSVHDCAYYILALAASTGHSLADDEFLIAGEPRLRAELSRELQRFAGYVMPAIIPSSLLHCGSALPQAPLELIVLPQCV